MIIKLNSWSWLHQLGFSPEDGVYRKSRGNEAVEVVLNDDGTVTATFFRDGVRYPRPVTAPREHVIHAAEQWNFASGLLDEFCFFISATPREEGK